MVSGVASGQSAIFEQSLNVASDWPEGWLDSGADPCADIAAYLSSRFNCREKLVDACAEPSVSICVH